MEYVIERLIQDIYGYSSFVLNFDLGGFAVRYDEYFTASHPFIRGLFVDNPGYVTLQFLPGTPFVLHQGDRP